MSRIVEHSAKSMHDKLMTLSVVAWEAVVVGILTAVGLVPTKDSPLIVAIASAIVITAVMMLLASTLDDADN